MTASACVDGWEPPDGGERPGIGPSDLDRPTIGIPEGPYLDQASKAGLSQFESAVDELSAAGYHVERVRAFDDIEAVNDRHRSLVAAEAAMVHHEWFEEYGNRYAEGTAELIREGRTVDVGTLAAARRGRGDLRGTLAARQSEHGIDAWASPAAPGPAPAGIDSTGDPVMNLPWTHAGVPTVALPAGRVDGLPVGLQLAAAFGADERLLAWAGDLATALDGSG